MQVWLWAFELIRYTSVIFQHANWWPVKRDFADFLRNLLANSSADLKTINCCQEATHWNVPILCVASNLAITSIAISHRAIIAVSFNLDTELYSLEGENVLACPVAIG
jgi:hypothetical protein